MRGLGSEKEVGVEIDHGVGPTGAVHPHRYAGVRAFAQITVHPQRDLNVLFARQKYLAHRHRLQRLLRNLSQHRRRVEPDFGALRRGVARRSRQSVVAEHVVHRRLEIGVAEALDDDPVDVRNLAVDRMCAVDAHDGPDADRRIDRRPEMEFVRSVWLPLGRYDAAQCFAHEMALRNSSQSRIPYDILSQRPSGSARGDVSDSTQREISSARSAGLSHSATSTRTNPHIASCPSGPRWRRYQLSTELLDRGDTRNTDERSPFRRPITILSESPST